MIWFVLLIIVTLLIFFVAFAAILFEAIQEEDWFYGIIAGLGVLAAILAAIILAVTLPWGEIWR